MYDYVCGASKERGEKVVPSMPCNWGQMALYELKSELAFSTENRHPKVRCHCPQEPNYGYIIGVWYVMTTICAPDVLNNSSARAHPFVYRETPSDE